MQIKSKCWENFYGRQQNKQECYKKDDNRKSGIFIVRLLRYIARQVYRQFIRSFLPFGESRFFISTKEKMTDENGRAPKENDVNFEGKTGNFEQISENLDPNNRNVEQKVETSEQKFDHSEQNVEKSEQIVIPEIENEMQPTVADTDREVVENINTTIVDPAPPENRLQSATVWTRKDIKEFKELIKKEQPGNMLKIDRLAG
uniref:Uncharacterized protein n=1 Tax=Romanomermis culicivorax TaxID=13658 RepID=A0A915JFT7_ROMCU